MEARLKLDTSFLPLLCQLKPGSFMITSSSPCLYILCSYIKAHVLKLCSLDSVFPIHAGMPASVRYSISAAHHTTRTHLEGFVQVVLRDQSAFSGFVYLFIYLFCWSCCISVGDHRLSSNSQIRNWEFGFAWQCAPCRWGPGRMSQLLKVTGESCPLGAQEGGFQLMSELPGDEPAWLVLALKGLA